MVIQFFIAVVTSPEIMNINILFKMIYDHIREILQILHWRL
jgi:hypothetical protein